MAHFLSFVLESVNEELRDNPSYPTNFYVQAKMARAVIAQALAIQDYKAELAAAAAFGGLVKRWRRWLIENLTFVALAGVDTSRENVRAWQQRMFGQAVASSRLKQYGKIERSGGGRVGQIELPAEIEINVIAFYQAHFEKIKSV